MDYAPQTGLFFRTTTSAQYPKDFIYEELSNLVQGVVAE